jgi:hypothetical protein
VGVVVGVLEVVDVVDVWIKLEHKINMINTRSLTVEVVLVVGGGVELDEVVEDETETYPQG